MLTAAAQGDVSAPPTFLKNAGNQWAKRAEFLMLANFGKISVQRLMVRTNDDGLFNEVTLTGP